jgi:hypothetical protein
MKTKSIFFIALSTITINIYTSESQALIDYQSTETLLVQDYKDYLQHQLKHYHDHPVSVDSLIKISFTITGENHKSYIRDIQNNKGETFLHVAVEKEDLPFINDMFTYFSTMHRNQEGKLPLDLAIKKLDPKTPRSNHENRIAILEAIAHRIAKHAYFQKDKEDCLEKIIGLELAYKAHPSPAFFFTPNKDLLHNLVPNAHKNNSSSFLAQLYQQATDPKTGNTFAHICIQQQNSDELLELVNADHISLTTNKEGLSPLDFALRAFREFTKQSADLETQQKSENFKRVRCCFFILYNYFKKSPTSSCCEKHKNIKIIENVEAR